MTDISPAPLRAPRRALLIWALTATFAAVVLGIAALFFWLRLRQANAALNEPGVIAVETSASRPLNPTAAGPGTNPFGKLQESEVAGRYRFFQDGAELGVITLLPDHSIINKGGTTYPRYHWEIQPGGIMTVWRRGNILLNVMEKPGVYVALKKDGTESMRIEKIQN